MPRMASTSADESMRWGSQKSSPHQLTLAERFCERLIGSIRRECLDHLVIFNGRHLRRVLSSHIYYYQSTRTHLSLDKDCPDLARSCHLGSEESSPSRKSVACITATNVSRLIRNPLHQRLRRAANTPSFEAL